MKMEQIIKKYFDCWLNNDANELSDIFAENIVYCECYGAEYHGLKEIIQWFQDWNQRGKVIQWDIKQIMCVEHKVIVEWYFACVYDQESSQFDGVTIAEFDENHKIVNLKEFESKHEHFYPYH